MASTSACSGSAAWTSRPSHAAARGVSSRPVGGPPLRSRGTITSTSTIRPISPTVVSAAAANVSAAGATSSSGDDEGDVESLVIIGSGPAGYTAAIYAGRANLRPMMFEGFQAGGVPGGQLMTTTEVENFPGFPEGVTGPDLMDRMRKQSERWGAVMHTEDVETVDFSVRPFVIRSTDRTVRAHAVILATGAVAKRLGIPSEEAYWSRGISACAICDGPSPIFKGAELAVVGGGDTATEEALYLTKYGRHVHLLVRGEHMRASKEMQSRVLSNHQITVHYNTDCMDAVGNSKGFMTGLRLRNRVSGEERELAVKGLFYGIGHTPNSAFFAGQVETDAEGYVVTKDGGAHTSVEGVFSAGDLHDKEWRQAITAAGSGCAAALSAERYLGSKGLLQELDNSKKAAAADSKMAAMGEAGAAMEGAAAVSAAASAAAASTKAAYDADPGSFDLGAVRHRGQFALRKLYHESARVLMVMYSGPSCGPCKRLKPMLDKVLDEYGQDVHFVEIDIEADPEIAEAAGVMGTPCVQVFKNKERVQVLNGVKMKKEYREVLDKALGKEAGVAV